jgi:uncharacterized membrane protein YuzA (DUF378 family)
MIQLSLILSVLNQGLTREINIVVGISAINIVAKVIRCMNHFFKLIYYLKYILVKCIHCYYRWYILGGICAVIYLIIFCVWGIYEILKKRSVRRRERSSMRQQPVPTNYNRVLPGGLQLLNFAFMFKFH